MGTMADKARILYLLLLILFLLTVGFFIFDYYGLIDADEIFPALAKKPSPVNWDKESPTEVEKLEYKKAREKLDEEIAEIERIRQSLDEEREKLQNENEKLNEMKKSIQEKEKQMAMAKKDLEKREAKVKVLANKIANMPPPKAIALLENWPDQDIIDVFKQMDKDAEEEGTNTITNYLITLFKDPKRQATITNKWLDHEADRIPNDNTSVLTE
ncbi:MAG TPA: flagellar protein FlbB [Leptospiraceae bacterium]|nr:flagellar protein FlbB [Leptospiraceae bacterium]HMX32724.1 flagellar protein FlbB [Leptospiraceae bacterium]HMY30185.1 flagellar protein FlbB [Leptospiraceae bacterium]HMZ65168.1 flagellar protein FlbB [Leptospiraceae bacterium]HNA06566.1 flagellar protein FlbB [Leptospiraceae bacterium]